MRIRQSPFGCSQYSLLAAATALMLSSQTGLAKDRMLPTKAGPIKVKTIAKGLQNPWGFAFLPDGQMLVTERPGRLRLVSKDGAVSKPLTGVPAIDPDFKIEPPRLFLLCGARRGRGFDRGGAWKLGESGLDDVEVIFRQVPKINGNLHFGSRLAFAPDGTLFITLGERFQFTPAKDLSNDLGKIVFASILMDRCPRTIPSLGARSAARNLVL